MSRAATVRERAPPPAPLQSVCSRRHHAARPAVLPQSAVLCRKLFPWRALPRPGVDSGASLQGGQVCKTNRTFCKLGFRRKFMNGSGMYCRSRQVCRICDVLSISPSLQNLCMGGDVVLSEKSPFHLDRAENPSWHLSNVPNAAARLPTALRRVRPAARQSSKLRKTRRSPNPRTSSNARRKNGMGLSLAGPASSSSG